ncbi:hypothetical protein BAUCODRAFT_399202 [Baudoinia panamericana UAMH 10762]|uniref:Uncharacterized protein n=1 Tax=Baudoinia panamericana (strain UAMH 10762) TaxID=717646 RepID=M2MR56_BAUPA|nr:uncharacterized protein BAUCODRAFT_399202 [Baudoinia panamericana UAMH 10762]EMC99321.1 hypothetical protein BAUCODRAFT_399202 [Baudoinia panamericana UAMH 10762]
MICKVLLLLMDWTGGARKRFTADKNNATVQKQKAYFAKVCAEPQQIPNSQRMFRPNYLDDVMLPPNNGLRDVAGQAWASRSGTRRPSADYGASGSHNRSKPSAATQHTGRHYRTSAVTAHSPTVPYAREGRSHIREPHCRLPHSRLPHVRSPIQQAVQTEDQRLENGRHRLLAQGDWLGLSLVRPLHMQFTSILDKDRVGKRRKLDKSARPKQAQQRLLSPLFEKRLIGPDYMMSGALPPQNVEIKIGSAALASQTQASKRSRTPVNTSMRHLSTECGSLSEESMLLDAHEDEMAQCDIAERAYSMANVTATEQLPLRVWDKVDALSFHATPSLPGLGSSEDASPSSLVQVMRSDNVRCSDLSILSKHHGPLDHLHAADTRDRAAESQLGPVTTVRQFGVVHANSHLAGSKNLPMNHSNCYNAHDPPVAPTPNAGHEENDSNEDDVWRRLLNIPQQSSSHASLAAVKSSSQHLSDASRQHIKVLPHFPESEEQDEQYMSTPRGVGTQGQPPGFIATTQPSSLTETQPPSASLKHIMHLAEGTIPSRPREKPAVNEDDDALWKEFIIGSGDDSSVRLSQSRPNASRMAYERPEDVATTEFSGNLTSGLGTSANATHADSAGLTPSTLSEQLTILGGRKSALMANSNNHLDRPQLSLRAEADTGSGREPVPDSEPPATSDATLKNIHAEKGAYPISTSKRRQTSYATTKHGDGTFKYPTNPSRKVKARKERDIYDLLDSDGESLA